MPDEIEAGGVRVPVRVADASGRPRSGGRKPSRSARATLGPDGLRIRLPPGGDPAERQRQVTHLLQWAQRAVSRDPDRFRPRLPRSYRDGGTLAAAGRRFTLDVSTADRRTGSARVVGNRIRLVLPAAADLATHQHHAARLVSGALAREFAGHLSALCDRLHHQHFSDVAAPERVSFRFTTRRWGSCSARGRLSISTRLLLAPARMLEYVCVHELAHLVHLDHSPLFWERVEHALPDFRDCEHWLQRHAFDCQY